MEEVQRTVLENVSLCQTSAALFPEPLVSVISSGFCWALCFASKLLQFSGSACCFLCHPTSLPLYFHFVLGSFSSGREQGKLDLQGQKFLRKISSFHMKHVKWQQIRWEFVPSPTDVPGDLLGCS